MTPLPRLASWDAFNGHLEEQCRNRQGNVLRGHRESIGERFVRDREALKRPLPAPFDACDKQGTRVNSLSLVRYRTNDYSVPVAYGHQEVWIRGYVHEVVIGCGAGIIARHPRSYDREDMVFDPIHYLALLEHKIGALDQAAPLAGWELPDAFPTLRRLLEARMGKAGKREYVQVLLEDRRRAAVRSLQPALRAGLDPGDLQLAFDEWTEIFGSERLTGALLDRLTHHVHILEMNGESYRLNQSQKRRKSPKIPV